jgi:sulfur carrier protein ThiS
MRVAAKGDGSGTQKGRSVITVTAVLLGMHRPLGPPGAAQRGRVDLHYEGEGVPLARVMRDLRMPADSSRIVFLDGHCIEADRVLKDGDTVTFVSQVGGG